MFKVRASFLRLVSDSRNRRSRACWRVDKDSATRETACRSGAMLKFWVVWDISYRKCVSCTPRMKDLCEMERKRCEGDMGVGVFVFWLFGDGIMERCLRWRGLPREAFWRCCGFDVVVIVCLLFPVSQFVWSAGGKGFVD